MKLINYFILLFLIFILIYVLNSRKSNLPIIAIASYGVHFSINENIKGIKNELAKHGFIENKNIKYVINDANFNNVIIPQMLSSLLSQKPKVIVTFWIDISQYAKNMINNIPIVYDSVTNPVKSGLIQEKYKSYKNIVGTSDKQDVESMLNFAQELLGAKSVGTIYLNSEMNSQIMIEELQDVCNKLNIKSILIPITNIKEIPFAMENFRNNVDFIYIKADGSIAALPLIAEIANSMKIPIICEDEENVKLNLVLASIGVNHYKIGQNTGEIIYKILSGKKIKDIKPIYPSEEDNIKAISKKQAENYGIKNFEKIVDIIY